jgi:hypothetical protein
VPSVATARPLRPNGRLGLLFGCLKWFLVVVLWMSAQVVLAEAAATEPGKRARPSFTDRGAPAVKSPARLWEAYPLNPSLPRQSVRTAPRSVTQVPSPRSPTKASEHQSGPSRPLTALFGVLAAVAALTALLVARLVRPRRRSEGEPPVEHVPEPQPARRDVPAEGLAHGRIAAREERRDGNAERRMPVLSTRSTPEAGHLLFIPTDDGYSLIERPGSPPALGSELGGSESGLDHRFSVSKIGASPLPRDARPCAYLERAGLIDGRLQGEQRNPE